MSEGINEEGEKHANLFLQVVLLSSMKKKPQTNGTAFRQSKLRQSEIWTKIHKEKTKCTTNYSDNEDQERIEKVTKCKYLGQKYTIHSYPKRRNVYHDQSRLELFFLQKKTTTTKPQKCSAKQNKKNPKNQTKTKINNQPTTAVATSRGRKRKRYFRLDNSPYHSNKFLTNVSYQQ